jgi:hypothetical protein
VSGWVETDSEATQFGGTSGMFDSSGMVVNYGAGGVTTTTAKGSGSAGAVLPTWLIVAVAAGALLWVIKRKR